jgi:hypothetical protein
MRSIRLAILAATLSAGTAFTAQAQSVSCLTTADSVVQFRHSISDIYTPADSATVIASGQPWARFANISAVTDSTTCAAAFVAYNQLAGETVTSAYVLALGGTGYAFILPGYVTSSGEVPVNIFGPSWQYLVTVLK